RTVDADITVTLRVDRPASIIARSVGSLELLSRGRATLVLESSPDDLESVEEAVDVIRALLDTTQQRATASGTHHRLDGAEPGPALDRAVPIWLRGSDAGTVELAGRVADGLIVDLDEVGLDGLADINAAVDGA